MIFILQIRQFRAFWCYFTKWFSRGPNNKKEQNRQLLRRLGSTICDLDGMVAAGSVPSSLTPAALNVFSGLELSFFLLVFVVVSILVCCVVWGLVVYFCGVEIWVVIATVFVASCGAIASWSVVGEHMMVDSDVSRAGLWGVGLTGCIMIPVAIVSSVNCGAGVVGWGRLRCACLQWFVQRLSIFTNSFNPNVEA